MPPRYDPARALPAYAYVPGIGMPHPVNHVNGHAYQHVIKVKQRAAQHWRERPVYLYGVDLYNHGYFWEAHEQWEALWRAVGADDPPQAAFLKGLIQMSAACLHLKRGKPVSFQRLAARGLTQLQQAPPRQEESCYMGLNLTTWRQLWRRWLQTHDHQVQARPLIELVF